MIGFFCDLGVMIADSERKYDVTANCHVTPQSANLGWVRYSPSIPRLQYGIWYASTRHISSPEDRITSIKHCAPPISSKMATIDEFVLKNIGLWWRYGISRYCDEWKYIIIGRIFESEIILIPPSLKISESSSNGIYRNTDEVWWRYGISRSCDECVTPFKLKRYNCPQICEPWNICGERLPDFAVDNGIYSSYE